MTEPRQVEPGDVVFSTARTVARFYLLRPDAELVQAGMYVLGHYAAKHGIVLYAACLMSTHLHLVYLDRWGRGPAFLRDAHRGIANVVKALRGFRGSVFEEDPNETRLLTRGAIADKIGYVMANPVAAGTVRYARDWTGLRSRVEDLGRRTFAAERPTLYFDPNGRMPARASLRFELPERLVERHGEEGTREVLEESFRDHERRAQAEVKAKGWTFLGLDRCLRISPYRRAKAYEVFGARNPTFATKGGGPEAFEQAVQKLRDFRQRYRERLLGWRAGDRESPWPFGTYLMRWLHGVVVADPPGLAPT
jgi:putative transposase